MSTSDAAAPALDDTGAPLSLYHLLEPEVLANPYPLYRRLRTEDPVHWDPYLHAWVVTRYEDIATVFRRFSADRTPAPEFFEAMGVPEVGPVARPGIRAHPTDPAASGGELRSGAPAHHPDHGMALIGLEGRRAGVRHAGAEAERQYEIVFDRVVAVPTAQLLDELFPAGLDRHARADPRAVAGRSVAGEPNLE